MVFKVVVSDPKTRKGYQKEVEEAGSGLVGKKIGEKVSGDFLGLSGYELEITGGSDKQGFPMRMDVDGIGRKRALLSGGVGFHPKIKGQRKRRSVRGNTISAQISQINVKVVKYGPKKIEELLGAKKKEEKKELTEDEKREKRAAEVAKITDQIKEGGEKEESKPEAKATEEGSKEKPNEETKTEEKPKEEKPAEKKEEKPPEKKEEKRSD